MTSFGDKPHSRWKPRRVVRRLLQASAVAAMLCVAFLLLMAAAFSSEAFWRRVLIPQYVGPLWESTIDYDSLRPQAFPPGVTFENLRFHEPGPGGAMVAQVKKFQLRTSYDLRSFDLRTLHVRGLALNYVVHPDGNSNWNIALERLFDRMPPSERLGDRVREGEQVMPHIRIRQIFLRDISVRYEDQRDPAVPMTASFNASEEVRVLLQPDAETFVPGILNDYLRVETSGQWAFQAGEWRSGGPASLSVELPSVDRFPHNVAHVRVALAPESGQRHFSAEADLPLDRVAFRALSTPLEKLHAEFTAGTGAAPIASFRNGRLDPLKGDLEGNLSIDASWEDLLGTARAFLDDDGYLRLQQKLDHAVPQRLHRQIVESAALAAEVRIKGTGLVQYAIIDPSERVPLEVATEGFVGLRHVDAGLVRQMLPGYADIVPMKTANPYPMDVDLSWRLSALEKENLGGLWLNLDARPQTQTAHEVRMGLTLSRQDKPREPVIFHPFGGEPLAPLLVKTLTTTPTLTNDYKFLPQYEPTVAQIGAHLIGAERALDAVGLEDAMLTQEVAITDPATLRGLMAPFWRVDNVTSATLAVSISRANAQAPSMIRASFGIRDVRLHDLADPVSVAAQAEAELDGAVVTFHDFTSSLTRGSGAGESVVGFGLAHRLPDGIEGPPLPSQIDLATGQSHGELEVTTIRREIVEVLLQLQTFGLSERLAQPLNQRFLQLLGFGPDDLNSRSVATIFISADMGAVARVRSVLRMDGLPAANFLFSETPASRGDERFNARLLQSASLDRRAQKIRAEAFELTLSTTSREQDVPFAILRLEPDDMTLLSYPALLQLAALEAGEFGDMQLSAPRRVKAILSGFFQRLERFKAATSGAGGRLVFELPNVDLAQFPNTLASAGLPVTAGTLDLKLVNSLRGTGATQQALAYGTFQLTGLQMQGMGEPLPELNGVLDVGQQGDRLVLENLFAEMDPTGIAEPLSLRFKGWTNINDDAGHWELRLDHLSGRLVGVLEQVNAAGLGQSTAILQSLPFDRLTEIAGDNGEVNFRFEADTAADGSTARLRSRQSGRDLIVFPSLFAPLSFDLRQDVTTTADGSFTVEALQGNLREEDVRSPLLELNLDKPAVFGRENGDQPVLTIAARKDLGEISRRLQEIPIPLFERRVLSGLAEGTLSIRFAPDAFVAPGAIRSTNDFELGVHDVMLEGLATPLDGTLKGSFASTTETLTLSGLTLDTAVGGRSTGRFAIDAQYDLVSRLLSGSLDLIDLRSELLQALPPSFARWAREDQSRLNGLVLAVVDPDAGRGELELALRARDFAMKPLPLQDGTVYTHPPLQLDLDVAASYDEQTSSVLVRNVSALLAKGEDSNPDRLAKLDPTLAPLLRVTESAPFRYDVATGELLRQNESGAGMDLEFGPIDMAEYGPAIRELTGIAVMKGSVAGSGAVLASGGRAARFDVSQLGFFLRDGVWIHPDGAELPVEADFVFRGGSRPEVFRLDELSGRIRYADGDEDQLTATGYVETEAGVDHLELNAMSRGVKLDRVLGFLQDMETYRNGNTDGKVDETKPKKPFEFPDNLTATLNGTLDNIRFKELTFPHTEIRANYANKQVEVEEFRSRLEEGLVSVQGVADFAQPRVPWSMKLRVEDLEARPWVNSFGTPKAHDTVRGKFLANASIRGEGFTNADMARNLVAEGIFGIRQGEVIDEGFRNVFGGESDFAADLRVMARSNRVLFELTTPWNPTRDVLMQGTLLNLFGVDGEPPYLRALVNFSRTTTVGPRWRRIEEDGARVPLRQTLFGMVMEIRGPVGKDESADLKLRSLEY